MDASLQLDISNRACRMLGERNITALTDTTENARLLTALWAEDPVYDWLEDGQWLFATRTQRIDYDPGITPDFGYRFAFEQPDDLVRVTALSASEYFTDPLNDTAFESGYIYAPVQTIYIRFVSEDPAYGKDTSLWSKKFIMYGAAWLAKQMAPRLSQSGPRIEMAEKEMKRLLAAAQALHPLTRPTTFPSS